MPRTQTIAKPRTASNDAKPITLQSIAHRMMAEANGDIEAAANKIFNYCGNYPRLAGELGMLAARSLAQQVPIAARQQAKTARADQSPHKFTSAIHAAQRRARRMGVSNSNALLNDPYTIGSICKPLREWCGDEIRDHGEKNLSAGKTQIRNAQFLIMVGTAAGASVIGESLDEDAVAKMRAEADALE